MLVLASNDVIRVEVTRSVVESVHLVDAAIVVDGELVQTWGDADAPVIPRSAIKSVQALPLVQTGAADAFGVTDRELALAIASHSGEPDHIDAVAAWLARIGMTPDALECGADRPIGVEAADGIVRSGTAFAPIHNCCSGKHAGFLTVARHLNIDPAGYVSPDHPIQLLVHESVEKATGCSFADQVPGVDGCGIPTYSMPVQALARGIGSLTFSADGSSADTRILQAGAANPWWVSGTDRWEVVLMAASKEPMSLKTGAEGVFVAALPERRMGIACKSRDGAKRAAEVAIAWILNQLGAINVDPLERPIMNKAGSVVGFEQVSRS